MEINEKDLKKVQEAFDERLQNANSNTQRVQFSNAEELKKIAENVGQRNTTALSDGETAEFFTMDEYEKNIDKYLIPTVTTSSTGRQYNRLYALVKRYFKVGSKKVGEHFDFIDIGGIVRYHYDLSEATKKEDGKWEGARRIINDDTFNKNLESQKLPWAMLSNVLAGKKISAKRSTNKLFHQRFEGGMPVRDEFVEQTYLIYNTANA